MESLFGTLKTESLNLKHFKTNQKARTELFKYIETF